MATAPEIYEGTPEMLVAAAQSGDRTAWEVLVVQFTPRIRWRARRFFLRGLDRDDVVQEGFIGFVNAVRTFRGGRQGFAAYADICVTRAIARAIRAQPPPLPELLREVPPDDSDLAQPLVVGHLAGLGEEAAQAQLLVDWLADLMSQTLRDDERLALLATLHDLTYSGVAQHLLRSEGVVGRLVRRARSKLRMAVEHDDSP